MPVVANIRGPAGPAGDAGPSHMAALQLLGDVTITPSVGLTEVAGSRVLVNGDDMGRELQMHLSVSLGIAIGTTEVSVRDASDTANVLASVTLANSLAVSLMKTPFAARPTWLAGEKTLAVFTSRAVISVVDFQDVSIRWR